LKIGNWHFGNFGFFDFLNFGFRFFKLNTEITLSRAIQGELLPKQESFEKTSFGSADIDFNVEINGYSASCSSISSGSKLNIRSNENEKVIKCKTTVNVPSDYVNVPVNIKLSYGFKKVIEGSSFTLKKSEESIA